MACLPTVMPLGQATPVAAIGRSGEFNARWTGTKTARAIFRSNWRIAGANDMKTNQPAPCASWTLRATGRPSRWTPNLTSPQRPNALPSQMMGTTKWVTIGWPNRGARSIAEPASTVHSDMQSEETPLD